MQRFGSVSTKALRRRVMVAASVDFGCRHASSTLSTSLPPLDDSATPAATGAGRTVELSGRRLPFSVDCLLLDDERYDEEGRAASSTGTTSAWRAASNLQSSVVDDEVAVGVEFSTDSSGTLPPPPPFSGPLSSGADELAASNFIAVDGTNNLEGRTDDELEFIDDFVGGDDLADLRAGQGAPASAGTAAVDSVLDDDFLEEATAGFDDDGALRPRAGTREFLSQWAPSAEGRGGGGEPSKRSVADSSGTEDTELESVGLSMPSVARGTATGQ